ncbi:MAG: GNAT family N-acetyltransferase [Clostridia bacterium]
MDGLEVRTFTEEEYHAFFMKYVPDPVMDPSPFRYSREQISRSYLYNHGGFRPDYAHFGVFLDQIPVGSLQLKRMDREKHSCEFGIILQNDDVKDRGIGTAAIMKLMDLAKEQYSMELMTGDTMGRNKRMIRVFEKLGFELIETVPDAFELPDGQKEDRLIYRKSLTEE